MKVNGKLWVRPVIAGFETDTNAKIFGISLYCLYFDGQSFVAHLGVGPRV